MSTTYPTIDQVRAETGFVIPQDMRLDQNCVRRWRKSRRLSLNTECKKVRVSRLGLGTCDVWFYAPAALAREAKRDAKKKPTIADIEKHGIWVSDMNSGYPHGQSGEWRRLDGRLKVGKDCKQIYVAFANRTPDAVWFYRRTALARERNKDLATIARAKQNSRTRWKDSEAIQDGRETLLRQKPAYAFLQVSKRTLLVWSTEGCEYLGGKRLFFTRKKIFGRWLRYWPVSQLEHLKQAHAAHSPKVEMYTLKETAEETGLHIRVLQSRRAEALGLKKQKESVVVVVRRSKSKKPYSRTISKTVFTKASVGAYTASHPRATLPPDAMPLIKFAKGLKISRGPVNTWAWKRLLPGAYKAKFQCGPHKTTYGWLIPIATYRIAKECMRQAKRDQWKFHKLLRERTLSWIAPKVNPRKLILARRERGYSQAALADQVDATQSVVSRYEAGLAQVPGERLERIAKALERPASFFYCDEKRNGLSCTQQTHPADNRTENGQQTQPPRRRPGRPKGSIDKDRVLRDQKLVQVFRDARAAGNNPSAESVGKVFQVDRSYARKVLIAAGIALSR